MERMKASSILFAAIVCVTAAPAAFASAAPAAPAVAARPAGEHLVARATLVAQEGYPPPPDQVVDEGTVYPATPPPDPIPEYPPPSPGYSYMWVNGYWDWNGYDWTWYSGFWTPRRAGVTFYAPRYAWVDGELVYYRGYWADPYGRREYGYGWRGQPPTAWRARPSVAPNWWREQHNNEGWRRAPGAPAAWRGPVRHEAIRRPGYVGAPAARPGEGYSKEKRPKMGAEERPLMEGGRPGGRETGPPPSNAGGFRGGPAGHAEQGAPGPSRTPVATSRTALGPAPAAHPAAPAARPAPPPPPHNAPSSRKK
jgi:hypothetical protein